MRSRGLHRGIAAAAGAALALAGFGAAAQARSLTAPVSAGPPGPIKINHLDLDGFFPATTEIHVGDSVSFAINGFHTVSFVPAGQAPPQLIVASSSSLVTGSLDAAGAPFWFNGKPNNVVNPQVALPSGGHTYAGSGYLNSGLPQPGAAHAPFVVKFTKAGTFTFNCLVHPGMKGLVKVLPAGKGVPTAAQDRAMAAKQASNAVKRALVLAKVKPPAATVLAGNDGPGPVAWLRFFPASLTVKVGTTVTFKMAAGREVHTITFGPEAVRSGIEKTFTAPLPAAGGPPTLLVNPLGAYPSDPPPLPPYTGTNHGNGFESSGLLALGGPLPSSVKVTFTKAGVYAFECVVHENMDGKVLVTQ